MGRLASCGGDRQIFLWDVATGKTIRKFRGHDSVVNAVRSHLALRNYLDKLLSSVVDTPYSWYIIYSERPQRAVFAAISSKSKS